MRVLVVTSQYHRGGGFPRYAVQLASGLDALGHDVSVLTRRAETGPSDGGIEFLSYRCASWTTLSTLLTEPWAVTRRLRRVGPEYDVILVVGLAVLYPVVLFGTGAHRAYFRENLSTLRPTSWRWWFERLRPFHRIVMAWEAAMHRRRYARRVVVGAERFRREYLDLFALPPEEVVVVPLGVEVDEFEFDPALRQRTRTEMGVSDSTRVLLDVAGRGRQKGLDVLVTALERLPNDVDWCAVLAGDGSVSRWMRQRARPLVDEGRVKLLGRVPDVPALYCAADCLAFPSRYDPWGLVVTESLAAGLPVAASSHAGASTAVRVGENGVVIDDPNDAEEVARRIVELWDVRFDRDAVAASVKDLSVGHQAERLVPHLEAVAAGA